MANGKKCFTFIWKIENASYFWQEENEYIVSPTFVIDEIEGTKWRLMFWPCYTGPGTNKLHLRLCRQPDSNDAEWIKIKWQVALLGSDGSVLSSCRQRVWNFSMNSPVMHDCLPADRGDVFVERRYEFLPQDTLTVRCSIWKSVGDMSQDIQWVSRTCIGIEKRSFLWKVGNFSSFKSEKKFTYKIKSCVGDLIITLDLFLTGGFNPDEFRLTVTPEDPKIKFFTLQVSVVDTLGNAVHYHQEEIRFDTPGEYEESSLCLSKPKLMEKTDILSLQCVCNFSACTILEEIERIFSDSNPFEKSGLENHSSLKENISLDLQRVLNNDMKSLLNERIQSDINLKTASKTYPAHKCILSARSPVFKAMFSSDMKEKISDCVIIEDLNDDTVFRMLQYIYSAEIEELEWGSAMQLYEASDKYEIISLREVCSSYLQSNLCRNNACEALVLADLHQDDGLKNFVQYFIVRQGKDMVFSKEWDQLMESNLKLAAETMRLKFKE